MGSTFVFAALVGLASPAAAQSSPLASLEWQYRPLVVFSSVDSQEAREALEGMLRDRQAAVADRDMLVILVRDGEVETWDPVTGAWRPGPAGAASLRSAFAGDRGEFEMVLIGKDGAVKARETRPEALSRILPLIDTMPMRQREMRAP